MPVPQEEEEEEMRVPEEEEKVLLALRHAPRTDDTQAVKNRKTTRNRCKRNKRNVKRIILVVDGCRRMARYSSVSK